MNIDDKFKDLKDQIPVLEKDLSHHIYKRSILRKKYFKGRFIYTVFGLTILCLMSIFAGAFIYINMDHYPALIRDKYDMSTRHYFSDNTYIIGSNVYSDLEDVFILKICDIDVDEIYFESIEDKIKELKVNDESVKVSFEDGIYTLDVREFNEIELYVEMVYKKNTFIKNLLARKTIFRSDDRPFYREDMYKIEFSVCTNISEGDKQKICYGFPKSKISEGYTIFASGETKSLEKALNYVHSNSFEGTIRFSNYNITNIRYVRENAYSLLRYSYGENTYKYIDAIRVTVEGEELSSDEIVQDWYDRQLKAFKCTNDIEVCGLTFDLYENSKYNSESLYESLIVYNDYKDNINQYLIIKFELYAVIVGEPIIEFNKLIEEASFI